MPNLVSFKVYLNKNNDDEKSEVRRLGIEQDVATSFSYLVEKLKSIFPCLQDSNCHLHLYWKDSDNDEVTISSDAELIIALTEMEAPLKKIYIKASPASEEHEQPSEEFLAGLNSCTREGDVPRDFHVGVICDGCESCVVGFRYKCVQCPDFDLCSTCEAKCVHPDHLMLRIPTPTKGLLGVQVCSCSGKKKGKCCCDTGERGNKDGRSEYPPFCPYSRKHGKRYLKHNVNRMLAEPHQLTRPWIESLMYIVNSADKQFNKHTSSAETGAQQAVPKSGCGSTRERSGDGKCQRGVQKSESTAPPNVNGDVPRASTSSTSGKTSESTKPAPADNTNNNGDFIGELLNTIGPIVANSLQKQGPIFDFINEILSDATSNNNNNTQNNRKSESTNTVNSAEVSKESNDKSSTTDGNTEVSSSSISQSKVASASEINKLVDGIEQLAVDNAASDRQPGTTDTITASPVEVASADSTGAKLADTDGIRVKGISVEQKEEDDGWTLLTQALAKKSSTEIGASSTGAIPKTTPNKEESTQQQGSLYPEIKPQYPENVAIGLRRMLAMGFSNEGNWLGDLLMKNNGDVAAVIDLLIPAKRNAF